jgi:tricorn protease
MKATHRLPRVTQVPSVPSVPAAARSSSLVLVSLLSACASAAGAAHAAGVAVDAQSRAVEGMRSTSQDAAAVPAGMLRFPDVSATDVVFVYADDLWLVPREGGIARPLASPPGLEVLPRFAPDGASIAFVGNYDGNRDLYTLPTSGGIPRRVTFHPSGESLCNWTGDGRLLYFTNGFAGRDRMVELYSVSAQGGLPSKLPVPYGAFADISADGRWLAYTPHTTDNRTWKRYRGGMSTDIWLFDLQEHTSLQATTWEGTDTAPMWHGGTLYYVSDEGPTHRQNLWSFEPKSGARKQLTRYADFDVKWASMGPGSAGGGEIVFQHGAELTLYDLQAGTTRTIEVEIPGARPKLRPRAVDASKFIDSWELSPSCKRVLLSARGDVWSLPAKEGSPRNVTATSGVAERDACWSPDGKWHAWMSDASGEYQVVLAPADGTSEPRELTREPGMFRRLLCFSADSKHLVFTDKTGALFLQPVEGGPARLLARDTWVGDLIGSAPSFSRDGRFVVFARSDDRTGTSRIAIVDVASGQEQWVTSGMFDDSLPQFDRKGDYLYFRRRGHFSPLYGELDTSFLYAGTEQLLVVPLRKDLKSPFAPKSDEETGESPEKQQPDTAKAGDGSSAAASQPVVAAAGQGAGDPAGSKPADPAEDAAKAVTIDFEDFERRAVLLPLDPGVFTQLGVNSDGALLFVRGSIQGIKAKTSLQAFDAFAEKPEAKTVREETQGFALSADGKRLLSLEEAGPMLGDAKAEAKFEAVSIAGMMVDIDPRAEWRQLFEDSWRMMRDFFYDPGMHGVDWDAVRTQYAVLLEDCASREDLSYVIREMISELNVGHAYYNGGDLGDEPRRGVGLLGCDYRLEDGAYRIARIHEGAPWDADARGPLSEPGVDVKEGDYVLAVNGIPLEATRDPWSPFQGLADRVVTLTVSQKPLRDASARTVVVRTLSSERDLRYRAWIEANRKRVADRTEGRVGYVYVPSTGLDGQNDLVRQLQGQLRAEALIIDERWNSGGQIPTRFIELLNRPVTNYWARRDGKDWTWPPDSHQGPKCMLINGLSGSGGDAFPFYFRQAGLGKLIGRRTWGGLVGLSGYPHLIDGGDIEVPSFAFYERDGTWGIEGHGVDPDIDVVDDPALMWQGGDPQLDRAIALMQEELVKHPYVAPGRPAYPDRSGMGLPPSDK